MWDEGWPICVIVTWKCVLMAWWQVQPGQQCQIRECDSKRHQGERGGRGGRERSDRRGLCYLPDFLQLNFYKMPPSCPTKFQKYLEHHTFHEMFLDIVLWAESPVDLGAFPSRLGEWNHPLRVFLSEILSQWSFVLPQQLPYGEMSGWWTLWQISFKYSPKTCGQTPPLSIAQPNIMSSQVPVAFIWVISDVVSSGQNLLSGLSE